MTTLIPATCAAFTLLLGGAHASFASASQGDAPEEASADSRPAEGIEPGEELVAQGSLRLDPGEFEAFFDGVMAAHLFNHDVAGATVAVVSGGELLFSKGYGYADVDEPVPVDPARTMFRIGSVTKPFTWAAILQLRDEGHLDLDADVNEYLGFSIPDTFEEPITLRHLMTHTPGLEDRVFGLFGLDVSADREKWLRENIPARVRAPGERVSYSNYGTALAGHIVERISGLSWEEYIEQRILDPLGMIYATPREPPPEELAEALSNGFAFEQGRFIPKPFETIGPAAPAGSISASAESMAPFMIALLNEGRYEDRQVLSEQGVSEMLKVATAPHPEVNGMTLGLYEKSARGARMVGHGGGTQWFFTDMALFPEENLGLFVSYNSAGGAMPATVGFIHAFLERHYPSKLATPEPPRDWEARADRYPGSYRMLRRSHTTFEKLLGLMMQSRVSLGEPGEVIVSSPMTGTIRFVELEPRLFETIDGLVRIGFTEDPKTGRTYLQQSFMPVVESERVGAAATPGFHLLIFIAWLAAFISIILLMPLRYLMQRRFEELEPLRGLERWLRWAALAVALLGLSFLIILMGNLSQEEFLSGDARGALVTSLALVLLAIVPGAVVLAGLVLAFIRGLWGLPGRIYYLLFSLGMLLFFAQLHYLNRIGFRM